MKKENTPEPASADPEAAFPRPKISSRVTTDCEAAKNRALRDWALSDPTARAGLQRFWELAYPGQRLVLPDPPALPTARRR